MAVALGKNDNAAAARDRPALRGLQAIVLPALRFLDRPTHAFKNAPCQHDCLKARDISELFRGSLGQIAALLVMAVVIRAWQKTIIWEQITRITNGMLIFFGFLLLLFQLHGYVHERGLIHGPEAGAEQPGELHSHDGGEPHVH